jgi:hypothetical protein
LLLLYVFIFFTFWFYALVSFPSGDSEFEKNLFLTIFILHGITMLWNFGLLIFYIVHLFKNGRIEESKKARWAIVLFFGGFIAAPIYWHLYVWPSESRKETSEAETTS